MHPEPTLTFGGAVPDCPLRAPVHHRLAGLNMTCANVDDLLATPADWSTDRSREDSASRPSNALSERLTVHGIKLATGTSTSLPSPYAR